MRYLRFTVFGQSEERLGLVLGAVDQRVGDAVIGDDREAIFLEAAAELLREGVGVAVGVGQRDGRDVVVGDRSHGARFTGEISRPASAALIRLASEPASSARRPSLAITGRWFGARPPVTAIWIAIELKLAKPHKREGDDRPAAVAERRRRPSCRGR